MDDLTLLQQKGCNPRTFFINEDVCWECSITVRGQTVSFVNQERDDAVADAVEYVARLGGAC